MQMNKERQIDLLSKLVSKHCETDVIDLEAEVDGSLSYQENKKKVIQKLREIGKLTDANYDQAYVDYLESEMISKVEEQAKEEQRKAFEQARSSASNIDRYYTDVIRTLKVMPTANSLHVVFIVGEGGWGKTFQIGNALLEMGFEEDKNTATGFHVIRGKSTYIELVKEFYEWRHTGFLILDDLYGVYENEGLMNILKAGTETISTKRFIENRTTAKVADELPKIFEFSPKLVIISNHIKSLDSPHVQALISRGRKFNIQFDYKTKIEILYEVAKSMKIPLEIVDGIKEMTSEASNFSIRTLLHAYDYYKADPTGWKEDTKGEIEADNVMILVKDLMKSGKTVNEQIKDFQNATGLSRREYFYMKRKIKNNLGLK